MSVQFLRAEEIKSANKVRLGIYGQNGVGKSTFLSSVPASYGVGIVFSADDENIKMFRGKEHIVVKKVFEWDELYDVAVRMLKATGTVQWLGFDTLTRFQTLAMRKVTGTKMSDDAIVESLKQTPRTPQGWGEWDKIGSLITDLVRVFNRVPVHLIYLMQENTRAPKFEGDLMETAPDLTPAALKGIKALLEVVGRLYVDERRQEKGELNLAGALAGGTSKINPDYQEQRLLLLGKHPRYFAKGPTHLLGYVVPDPTFETITGPIIAEGAKPNVAANPA